MEKYHYVDIFTDCQAVVDGLSAMLSAHADGKRGRIHEHADIWDVIQIHVQARSCDAIRVFKVKAHVQWQSLPESRERFWAYCNDVVDRSAKKAVVCDNFDLWQRMQSIVNKREAIAKHMCRVHSLLAEIHIGYHDHVDDTKGTPVDQPCDIAIVPTPPFYSLPKPTDVQIDQAKFGTKFLHIFGDWIGSLQWGGAEHCSCLELYFAFALATKCLVPVLIPKQGYLLRQDAMIADVAPLGLRVQSVVWIKIIRWWLKSIGEPFSVVRGLGLSPFGYSIPVAGIPCRPCFTHADRISKELWSYFHVKGQPKTYRDMKRPWTFSHVDASSS